MFFRRKQTPKSKEEEKRIDRDSRDSDDLFFWAMAYPIIFGDSGHDNQTNFSDGDFGGSSGGDF
ncbi:MAG: hypothetical protein KM296_00370 [Brockia lithotrophica]|nr:hypothetical protein [Brockia lithotrophica]